MQLTVNGAPLAGALDIFVARADGTADPAFKITDMSVESTGQQITLTIQISSDAPKGDHVLKVLTPNGESTVTPQAGNVLTVL